MSDERRYQDRADELVATWIMDSGQFARVKLGDLNDRLAELLSTVAAEATAPLEARVAELVAYLTTAKGQCRENSAAEGSACCQLHRGIPPCALVRLTESRRLRASNEGGDA